MNRLAKGSRWAARATNTRETLNQKTNFITKGSFRVLCGANFLDKPDGSLSPWCMKSSKRPRILKVPVTQSNLIIFLHRFVCASNGCIIVTKTLCMRKARDLGLQACHNKLPVDIIVCVSLAVRCMCVNFPEFPCYFLLNFLAGTNTMVADIPTYSVLDFP